MKKLLATIQPIIFLILLVPCDALPQEPGKTNGLRLAVAISQSFGDTKYELRVKADNPLQPGTLTDIRSELKFPLDVTTVGVTARWEPGQPRSRRWALSAGVHTNVSNPSGKMTDQDWIGSKQIGFTESDPEMDMIMASAEVRYLIHQRQRTALFLLFQFDYDWVEQHLVGFEGWRASVFSDDRIPVSGNAPVIDYEVQYLSPQLGAAMTHLAGNHWRLGAQAAAGVVYASDTDDHLLRGRISEGSGWGLGLSSQLSVDLLPGFLPVSWLSTHLLGELRFFHAEGEVDQRWYRDEDLPAGTEIPDIPYEMESLQARIGLSLGLSF